MRTQHLSVPARIKFACRHYFPTASDVAAIEKLMRKHCPVGLRIEDLNPRDFGQVARTVMGRHWK